MTISTPSATAPSAQRASTPQTPSETLLWTNGVKRTHDKGLDTYALPNPRPGVAASISVRPRWGGLRAPLVTATDAQGRPLETATQRDGFHRVLVAVDPQTGLETRLDPQAQTIDVTAPTESASTGCFPLYGSTDQHTSAHEHVDARGNVTFSADAFERASGFTPIVAGAVFRTSGVEVTTFPADGSRPTSLLREGDDRSAWLWCGLPCFVSSASSAVESTTLRASAPEADGRFTVMDPQTGQVRQRQLFVRP